MATLVLVSSITAVVATALIVLTTQLHRAASLLSSSVESVRLAEEVEVDLLLHDRENSLLMRASLAGDLERKLFQAQRHVTNQEENSLLARATSDVKEYLEEPSHPDPAGDDPTRGSLERAFRSMESVVTVNLAQARRAVAFAARWNDISNFIGGAVFVFMLAVVASVTLWFRRAVFQPIVEIAAGIERFAHGDRDSRVAEHGPAELALIAARFNEMAETLTRRREDQLAFLAAVAHDLRNPLHAISLAAAALPDDASGGEGRERRVLRQQTMRMTRMVEDLLDTASIEAGRLQLRLTKVDLRDELAEVIELYRPTTTKHELIVSMPDDPLWADVDGTRIQQVLGNLIGNAIKYSPTGGTIKVELARVDLTAHITVKDEGIGISLDDQPHVFEPFRRTRASRDAFQGIGLGLSVVRRVVEAHHGVVDVVSTPGKGSTFRVVLPAH
ncbi:MAG: HAMP domain-containing sensor histidine kinase [Deltaproteobacteria bacterium]|nr:HAMP domain-containing sensor histidine kinase [Deltaproteobacteria bacterium]